MNSFMLREGVEQRGMNTIEVKLGEVGKLKEAMHSVRLDGRKAWLQPISASEGRAWEMKTEKKVAQTEQNWSKKSSFLACQKIRVFNRTLQNYIKNSVQNFSFHYISFQIFPYKNCVKWNSNHPLNFFLSFFKNNPFFQENFVFEKFQPALNVRQQTVVSGGMRASGGGSTLDVGQGRWKRGEFG